MAGIIDDVYGANFVDGGKDGNVQDQNGHGTFVTGVVGAVGNNNLGVTGVNQIANVMSCRFMDATGNGWVSDAIRCMDYCLSFNSHVIQASWGGVAYSDSLQVRNCAKRHEMPCLFCKVLVIQFSLKAAASFAPKGL